MTEWREPDLTIDADDDPYSKAEFRAEPGRIVMGVGYDCNCAEITYTLGVEQLGQLRALIERAFELEIAELPRSGRMIAPLDLPGAPDASFSDAVTAFLRGGTEEQSDGWSSFEVPPAEGMRGVRYWVPATGVGPTPLPPPPRELIREREEASDG